MTDSRSVLCLALLGAIQSAPAQWEPLGAPGTFSVQFLVDHKEKAYAGIERGLFAGDRDDTGLTIFRPADPASSGLNAATSWGDDFVTGSTQGRVVVYSNLALAQRRIDAHPTIQTITALAGVGSVLLVGSYEGVHRSTDTLQSAVLTSDSAGIKGVNQIAVLDSEVYAASDYGLFLSRDTGATWVKVPTPRRKVNDLARFQDTLFLATDAGLYRSADAGAAWLDPLWPTDLFSRVFVRGDRFYAITQTELWRKAPSTPWTQVRLPLAGQYLDLLPLGRTEWVASYFGISVSEGGGRWEAAKTTFTPSPANIQALAHDGDFLLAGTETRGAFVSSDRGRTWTMRSHPFHYGGVYGILANTMHQGTWFSTTRQGIFRSADSGLTWDLTNLGLPTDFSTNSFFAQGSRLWAGTEKGLYFTDNHGDSWSSSPDGPAGQSVYDLAVTRSGTLFAATDTGLQKSQAPYETWTPTELALGSTVRLAQRGDTLYVSGQAAGPWRSLDGGQTWREVKSGLPGPYLQGILPGTHQAMATDGLGELFVIGHADTAWRSFQGNLPESGVGAQILVDDTAYVWSRFSRMHRRALPGASTAIENLRRRNLSRPFAYDARFAALRLEDPAAIEHVLVRDLAGRAVLQAPARTGWLSLSRLPSGLYTATIAYRDRPPVSATVLRR